MSPELQPMAVQYYCQEAPSILRDQYTALSLEGVLVTWHRHISYIYTVWYNFDTVICQFLETGTSDRCLIGIVQLLRFSGFTIYSLSFFLYSPFKSIFKSNRYLFSENSSTTDKFLTHKIKISVCQINILMHCYKSWRVLNQIRTWI